MTTLAKHYEKVVSSYRLVGGFVPLNENKKLCDENYRYVMPIIKQFGERADFERAVHELQSAFYQKAA